MSILSGIKKVIPYFKNEDGNYEQLSYKTSSQTVDFDDGNTAETKLGAIDGITKSLNSTSDSVAISASAGKSLQDQITALNSNIEWKKLGTITPSVTSLQMPTEYRELNIVFTIKSTVRLFINVPAGAIGGMNRSYKTGYYASSPFTALCSIDITTSVIYNANIWQNGTEIKSNYECEVYYR